MIKHKLKLFALPVLLLALPVNAAQFPIATTAGTELTLNVAFDGTNYLAAILGDASGGNNITAQLFSTNGTLVGSRISTGRTGSVPGGIPFVAYGTNTYLMVWEDSATTNDVTYGQLISPAGALQGAAFAISAHASFRQNLAPPGVSFGKTNFLAVWNDDRNVSFDIYGRLVSPAGALGSEIAIATGSAKQVEPAVAFDGTNYLVVWEQMNGSQWDVYGVMVSQAGTVGSPFQINQVSSPSYNPLSLAFDGSQYLVAWNRDIGGGSIVWDIYARFVTAGGTASGSEFAVTAAAGNQIMPRLAFGQGNYCILWSDKLFDGTGNYTVTGRFFNPSGQSVGTEFTPFTNVVSSQPMLAGVINDGTQFMAVGALGEVNTSTKQITSGDVYGTFIQSLQLSNAVPGIINQPVSQTNVVGSWTSFTISAYGTAPLFYQWRLNGTNLTNSGLIYGVTTTNLALTNIQTSSAGDYTVVVTNAFGSITSSVASLAVLLPAPASDFEYASDGSTITITKYIGLGGLVIIPSLIGGLPVVSLGDYSFQNSASITNVVIPNSVTSIGSSVFSGCSKLVGVTIPGSVGSIGSRAFLVCGRLKSIIIPDGVTDIPDSLFDYCGNLVSVTLPPSLRSIGSYSFANCSSLTSLTIPPGITSIGDYAFNFCALANVINLPDSVTNIGSYAFRYCSLLTGANLPCNTGDGAFENCSGLQYVTISDNVTSLGSGTFGGCANLANINVGVSNIVYSSIAGVLFNKSQTTLLECPPGKTGIYAVSDGVTNIASVAFGGCSRLSSVTIPGSVSIIDSYTFSGCSGLTNITIPNSVTNIRDYAFNGCSSLSSISIPASVFSLGYGAFTSCSGLKYFIIPVGITAIPNELFRWCYGLTNVFIPNGVTTIGSHAFDSCGITSITIPTSVTNIGMAAFIYCRMLENISIPNSVISIGIQAFGACSGLTRVAIPSSVSNLGDTAFMDCTNLTSIAICSNITQIANYTFYNCPKLTAVHFLGNAPTVGLSVFYNDTNAIVYYMPGTAGWDATFGGRPTMLWNPQAQTSGASFGVKTKRFGFNIAGSSGLVIVVECSTNLLDWVPASTNTLMSGTSYFSDPAWTNYPGRFYRIRSP